MNGMKLFFVWGCAAAAAMWIGALATLPPADPAGRKVIYWSTDGNPARVAQIAPFEKANPTLKVKVEPNTFEKTIVQCSTGVGPDLIEIYTVSDMVAYAESGILLDLTPYLDKYGISGSVTYPSLVGNLVYDGKQYRFPANAGSQVLIYNKRKFREAGVPEPTESMAWPDFIERIRPLTVARPNGAGYEQFALMLPEWCVKDITLQYGAHFFNETRTRCTLDSPEFITALNLYRDLMTTEKIIPAPTDSKALSGSGGWGNGEMDWFSSGRGGCLWGARWMWVVLRKNPELRKELGVVALPHMPGRETACYSGARGPAVNVNSRNRDEALRFLGYLASEEYGSIICQSSDGMPPNAAYGNNPANLANPAYPEEADFHQQFIDSMAHAEAEQTSPFVNPKIVDRVWKETTDYIANGLKTPEEALRDSAKRINDEIARSIADDPKLKARYDALVQKGS